MGGKQDQENNINQINASYCNCLNNDHQQKNNYQKDEISSYLSQLHNKYSNNAEQKYLNQMYDIGILVANKPFNQKKMEEVINKILEKKSEDPIKRIKEEKKRSLIDAFKRGIEDGMSDDYAIAYNNANIYQYDSEKIKKRARIDYLMNQFNSKNQISPRIQIQINPKN
jgi:hypothetical protein